MKYRTRIYYSESQKALMWDRWQQGESLHSIARLFDRHHPSIAGILSRTGGIRPPERKRSSRSLTLSQREEISRGIATPLSMREIASQLGRSLSTVSREINRNGGTHHYRASVAENAAWERALRPKTCKLAGNYRLIRLIEKKLRCHWSPQQIAGWAKRHYPEDERYHVSHETIYKSLYIQARGVLKKELIQYLKTRRIMRRAKTSSLKRQGLGTIPDAVSISERPASVEDRAVPGHWEGDLIAGTNNSYIATLVRLYGYRR